MKPSSKILASLLVVFVIMVGIVAYHSSSQASVKIGVIAPLTGLLSGGSNLGQNFANGVTLAYEQYQKAGRKPPVSIDIQDDGYDPAKGVSAYHQLMDVDHINALINLSSPTIDAIAADVTAHKDLPVIQLGSQSDPADDTILELYPDQAYGVVTISNLINQAGYKKTVVATQQLDVYTKWVSGFSTDNKGQTVTESVGPDETDFGPMALKIEQDKPDALVIFMGSKQGAQLIKKLVELGYRLPPLYFDVSLALGISDYQNILGSLDPLDGSTGIAVKNTVTDSFKADYQARFNSQPGPLAEYGYDAFNLLMTEYDPDGQKWVSSLKSASFDGASGHVAFDALGLRLPEFDIVKVQDGKLVTQ